MKLIGVFFMILGIVAMMLCEELVTAAIWITIIGFSLMFIKDETNTKNKRI